MPFDQGLHYGLDMVQVYGGFVIEHKYNVGLKELVYFGIQSLKQSGPFSAVNCHVDRTQLFTLAGDISLTYHRYPKNVINVLLNRQRCLEACFMLRTEKPRKLELKSGSTSIMSF